MIAANLCFLVMSTGSAAQIGKSPDAQVASGVDVVARRNAGSRSGLGQDAAHDARKETLAGVNPADIARQLGHKNPTMLFKHYGKWIDGADHGAEAAKLDAILIFVIRKRDMFASRRAFAC